MKALIISNPFKGTLSSLEIGEIVSSHLNRLGIESKYIPSTDGGDGFLDAMRYIHKESTVKYVLARKAIGNEMMKVPYLYDSFSKTSFISISDTCGIKYLSDDEKDPIHANTYGFGEVIKQSILEDRPESIILGLGGSASVDLGCGMLEALGTKFYDKNNHEITGMCNEKLKDVERADFSLIELLTKGIKFKVMLDVSCMVLHDGACDLYSRTKGASLSDVFMISNNIETFMNRFLIEDEMGYGAAGGTSLSLSRYLHAEMMSGSDEFLKMIEIDKLLDKYSLVITGEGMYDRETLQGKLIKKIMDHNPKNLLVLCAIDTINDNPNVKAIVPNVSTKEESMYDPKGSLRKLLLTIDFSKYI